MDCLQLYVSCSSDSETETETNYLDVIRTEARSTQKSRHVPCSDTLTNESGAETESETESEGDGDDAEQDGMEEGQEEEEEEREEEEEEEEEESCNKKPRKAYAIKTNELTSEMRHLLKKIKQFWTKPHNLTRRSQPVQITTYDKAQERLLCYLGFAKSSSDRGDADLFTDLEMIETYLDFLKTEKQLNPGTMANHIGSIIYAVKYFHRVSAPKYHDVAVIGQLRAISTQLQKEGERIRPKTKEELECLGKWVSWEEFLRALRKQKLAYDLADGDLDRAQTLRDLIVLSLYTLLPPARALEVRTLQIFIESDDYKFRLSTEGNFMVLKLDGSIVIQYNSYKTSKTYGRDLTIIEKEDMLSQWIADFVLQERNHLLKEECDTLFLNRHGEAYTGPAFTSYLKRLFHGLIGKSASVQALRSAFITYAYSDGNCTDSIKDAIASALRHSRKEGQKTYDRRTSNERKQLAIDYAHRNAVSALRESAVSSSYMPKAGEFVGLVQEGSTARRPKVLVGQAHYLSGRDVHLIWYEPVENKRNCFKIGFDGKAWVEGADCLTPVNMQPTNEHSIYRLLTKPSEIHKAIFS